MVADVEPWFVDEEGDVAAVVDGEAVVCGELVDDEGAG